jgi:hypothetical protein
MTLGQRVLLDCLWLTRVSPRRAPLASARADLLSRGAQVRVLPGAPHLEGPVDNWWTIGGASQSLTGTPHLLADRPELAAAFPDAGHGFPQFFVRDVQVALRLLDVGMSEHQLNRADVDAVGQKPAGAFVPEIVPMKVDLPELGPIDASTRLSALGVVTIR